MTGSPLRSSLPQPDTHGWYVFHAGQEIRCPGTARAGHCNRYMGTVECGVTCVREAVQLHEGIERRQHPRISRRCLKSDGGCGTALQIESRPVTEAAA